MTRERKPQAANAPQGRDDADCAAFQVRPAGSTENSMRSLAEIQQLLPTSPDSGLSPDAVANSRAQFGGNHLTPLPRPPLWRKFLEKFDEPIIKILLAAALL